MGAKANKLGPFLLSFFLLPSFLFFLPSLFLPPSLPLPSPLPYLTPPSSSIPPSFCPFVPPSFSLSFFLSFVVPYPSAIRLLSSLPLLLLPSPSLLPLFLAPSWPPCMFLKYWALLHRKNQNSRHPSLQLSWWSPWGVYCILPTIMTKISNLCLRLT